MVIKPKVMTDKSSMSEIGLGMSNCGPSIDPGLAETLKKHPMQVCAQYSGWNFCGYVWFDGKEYVCQVWIYKSPREEIKADTLEEIMKEVSNKYGFE